jgi:hypothetical protein
MMAGQQDYLPSFRQGFARCDAESEYAELRRGLVGTWAPLLGMTGAKLPDWSGNGRTAVNSSTYVTWRAGEQGPALYGVSGTDSAAMAIPYWSTGMSFSIAAFAKLDTVSGMQPIATGSATGHGFSLANGNVCWTDRGGTTTSSPAGLVAAGRWNLLGIAVSQGTGSFFLNGTSCGAMTAEPRTIDRIVSETVNRILGLVSFVGFWNRPLTAAEWQRLTVEPHSLFVPRRTAIGPSPLHRIAAAYRRRLVSAYGASQ